MQKGMRKTLIARSTFLFVSIALFIGIYSVPVAAHADTTVCNTPVIGNLTSHIYNGHLDSFDYYVSDPTGTAYLPLASSINGKGIDLNYISVWHNAGTNKVKIHVDVPDEMFLAQNLTINVGILQITQGPPPICISQGVFHVNLPTSYVPTPVGTTPSPVVTYPTPITVPSPVVSQPTPVTSNPVPVQSNPTTSTPVLPAGAQCYALSSNWLFLLALLDVVVSIALLLLMSFIAHSNGRLIAAVLIPPAVFIALWYFINTCHGAIWFPILSVILAIIVLTASGTPEYFEVYRVKIMQFFGKRVKNTQLKLSEASSIMEVK